MDDDAFTSYGYRQCRLGSTYWSQAVLNLLSVPCK